MDWQKMITELHAADQSLRTIANKVGLSAQCVHDIEMGRQLTVRWEVGEAIIKLHRKMIRAGSRRPATGHNHTKDTT